MKVTLTVSKTKIGVHETAITSYEKKISILHCHALGGFILFATTIEN